MSLDAACSTLFTALLQRNEQALEVALKSETLCISQKNFFRQTAFHLATKWATGLKMLHGTGLATESDLNQKDCGELTALQYTMWQGSSACMQLLLDAGAEIQISGWLRTTHRCEKQVLEAMHRRRQHFWSLVCMSRESKHRLCEDYGIFSSDSTARICLELLDRDGIFVPQSLRSAVVSHGTIFS
jgi:hypothetical protein